MRSTYYPGVCTKPGTYYKGWFMYMRYINRDRMRSTYYPGVCTKPARYLLTKFHCMSRNKGSGLAAQD